MRKLALRLSRKFKNTKKGASLMFLVITFAILLVLGTAFGVMGYRSFSVAYGKMAKQQALNTAKTTLQFVESEFETNKTFKERIVKALDAAILDSEFNYIETIDQQNKKISNIKDFSVRIPIKFFVNNNNLSTNSENNAINKYDEERLKQGKKDFGESYIEVSYANEEKNLIDFNIVGEYKGYTDVIKIKLSKYTNAEKELNKALKNSLFLKTPIVNIVGKEIIGDLYIDTPVEYEISDFNKKTAVPKNNTYDKFNKIFCGVYNGYIENGYSIPENAIGHTKKRDIFDYDIDMANWWTEVYIRKMFIDPQKIKIPGFTTTEYDSLKRELKLFAGYGINGRPQIEEEHFYTSMNGNLMINSDALIGLYDKGGYSDGMLINDYLLEGQKNPKGASEHGFGKLAGCTYDFRVIGKISFEGQSSGQGLRETYLGVDGDVYVNGNARVENFYQTNTKKDSLSNGSLYVTGTLVIDGSSREHDYNPSEYPSSATWYKPYKNVWINGDVYVDGNCYIKNANIGGNVYVSGKICEIEDTNIGGNVYVLNKKRDLLPSTSVLSDIAENKENTGIINDGSINEKAPNYIIIDQKFFGKDASKYYLNKEQIDIARKQLWKNNGRYYIVKVSSRSHYNIDGAKKARNFWDTQYGDSYFVNSNGQILIEYDPETKTHYAVENREGHYNERQIPITFIRERVNIGGSVKVDTSLIMQFNSNLYGDIYCRPKFEKNNGNRIDQDADKSFCILNTKAFYTYQEAEGKLDNDTKIFPNAPQINNQRYTVYGNIYTTASKFSMTNIDVEQRVERVKSKDKIEDREALKAVGGNIIQKISEERLQYTSTIKNINENFMIFNNVNKFSPGDIYTNSPIVLLKRSVLNANFYSQNTSQDIFNKNSEISDRKGAFEMINSTIIGDANIGKISEEVEFKDTVYLDNSYIEGNIQIIGSLKAEKLNSEFKTNGNLNVTGQINFINTKKVKIGGSIYSEKDINLTNVEVQALKSNGIKFAVKSLGSINLNEFSSQSGSIIANNDINIVNGSIANGKVISLFGSVSVKAPEQGRNRYLVRFLDEDGSVLYSYTVNSNDKEANIHEPNFKPYKEGKVFYGWYKVSNKINDDFKSTRKDFSITNGPEVIKYYFSSNFKDALEKIDRGIQNKNASDIVIGKSELQREAFKFYTKINSNIDLVAFYYDYPIPVESKGIDFNNKIEINYSNSTDPEQNNSTIGSFKNSSKNLLPEKLTLLMDNGLYGFVDVTWDVYSREFDKANGKYIYTKLNDDNEKTKISTQNNAYNYYFIPTMTISNTLNENVVITVSLINNDQMSMIQFYSNDGNTLLGTQSFKTGSSKLQYLYDSEDILLSDKLFLGWSKNSNSNVILDKELPIESQIDLSEKQIKLYAVFRDLSNTINLENKEVLTDSPTEPEKKGNIIDNNSDLFYPIYKEYYELGNKKEENDFISTIYVAEGWYSTFNDFKQILPEEYSLTFKTGQVKNYDVKWKEPNNYSSVAGNEFEVVLDLDNTTGYNIQAPSNDIKEKAIFKFKVKVISKEEFKSKYILVSVLGKSPEDTSKKPKRRVLMSLLKENNTPLSYQTGFFLNSGYNDEGKDRVFSEGVYPVQRTENGDKWIYYNILTQQKDASIPVFEGGNTVDQTSVQKLYELANYNEGRIMVQPVYEAASPVPSRILYGPSSNQSYYQTSDISIEDILPREVTYRLSNGEIKKIKNISTPTEQNISKSYSDNSLRYVLVEGYNESNELISDSELSFSKNNGVYKPGRYKFALYKNNILYKPDGINLDTTLIITIIKKEKNKNNIFFMSYEQDKETDDGANIISLYTAKSNENVEISSIIPPNYLFRKKHKVKENVWYFYDNFKKYDDPTLSNKNTKHIFNFEKTLLENYREYKNDNTLTKLPSDKIYLYPEFTKYKVKSIDSIVCLQEDLSYKGITEDSITSGSTLKHQTYFPFIQRFMIQMDNGEQITVDVKTTSASNQYQIFNNDLWRDAVNNKKILYDKSTSTPKKFKVYLNEEDFDFSNIEDETLKEEIKEALKKNVIKKDEKNISNVYIYNPQADKEYMTIDEIIAKKDVIINRSVEKNSNDIKFKDVYKQKANENSSDELGFDNQTIIVNSIYIYSENIEAGRNIYLNRVKLKPEDTSSSQVGLVTDNGIIVISNSDIEGDIISKTTQKVDHGVIDENFYGINIFNTKVIGNIKSISQIFLTNTSSFEIGNKNKTNDNQTLLDGEVINDYDYKILSTKNLSIESKENIRIQSVEFLNNNLIKNRTALLSNIKSEKELKVDRGLTMIKGDVSAVKNVNIGKSPYNNSEVYVYIDGNVLSKGTINIGSELYNQLIIVNGDILAKSDINLSNIMTDVKYYKFFDAYDNIFDKDTGGYSYLRLLLVYLKVSAFETLTKNYLIPDIESTTYHSMLTHKNSKIRTESGNLSLSRCVYIFSDLYVKSNYLSIPGQYIKYIKNVYFINQNLNKVEFISDGGKTLVQNTIQAHADIKLKNIATKKVFSTKNIEASSVIAEDFAAFENITVDDTGIEDIEKSHIYSMNRFPTDQNIKVEYNGTIFKPKETRTIKLKGNPNVGLHTDEKDEVNIVDKVTFIDGTSLYKLDYNNQEIIYGPEYSSFSKIKDYVYKEGDKSGDNLFDVNKILKIKNLKVLSTSNGNINFAALVYNYEQERDVTFNSLIAFAKNYKSHNAFKNTFTKYVYVNGNLETNKDIFNYDFNGSENNKDFIAAPFVAVKGDFKATTGTNINSALIVSNNNVLINKIDRLGTSHHIDTNGIETGNSYKEKIKIKSVVIFAENNVTINASDSEKTFLSQINAKNINIKRGSSNIDDGSGTLYLRGRLFALETLTLDFNHAYEYSYYSRKYRKVVFDRGSDDVGDKLANFEIIANLYKVIKDRKYNDMFDENVPIYKIPFKYVDDNSRIAYDITKLYPWASTSARGMSDAKISKSELETLYYNRKSVYDRTLKAPSEYCSITIYPEMFDIKYENEPTNLNSTDNFTFNKQISVDNFDTESFNFDKDIIKILKDLNLKGEDYSNDTKNKNILNSNLAQSINEGFINYEKNPRFKELTSNDLYFDNHNIVYKNVGTGIIRQIDDRGYSIYQQNMNDFWLKNLVRARPWTWTINKTLPKGKQYEYLENNSFTADLPGKTINKDLVFEDKFIIPDGKILYIDTRNRNINLIFKKGIKIGKKAQLLIYGHNQVFMFFESDNNTYKPRVSNPEITINQEAHVGISVPISSSLSSGSLYIISKDRVTMRVDEGVKKPTQSSAPETICKMFAYMPNGFLYYTGNNKITMTGSYCIGTYLLNGSLVDVGSTIKSLFAPNMIDYSVLFTYNDLSYLRGESNINLSGDFFDFGTNQEEKEYYNKGSWETMRYYH